MRTKWIMAVIGSLWACLTYAQDSTIKQKVRFKLSVAVGGSYQFWRPVLRDNYDKNAWNDPNMKVKIQSGQGWNTGLQGSVYYRKGFLSRMELAFQHVENSVAITLKEPRPSQLEYLHNEEYDLNLTLLPLGYKYKVKEFSMAAALGSGIYGGLSGQGTYWRWTPDVKNEEEEGPYWVWPPFITGLFYTTQLQVDYQRWHIAANMNWNMRYPIDVWHRFWVSRMNDGSYCLYKKHTLDLRVGYQF